MTLYGFGATMILAETGSRSISLGAVGSLAKLYFCIMVVKKMKSVSLASSIPRHCRFPNENGTKASCLMIFFRTGSMNRSGLKT